LAKNVTLLRWIALIGTALTVFAIDQIAKAYVTGIMTYGQSIAPIPAISEFFLVTLSQNRGAAFSLLPQMGDIFLIIALVMITGVLLFYRKMPPGHWAERIALGMMVGGASGNAFDRLRLGYVVDFFHIQIRPVLSNVSNFADHAIVLGVIIMLIAGFVRERAERKHAAAIRDGSSF
jgi:signal peptidase II